MPIWKIEDNRPVKVTATKAHHEQVLEKNLEDWLVSDPDVLGEPLFIIGRQVEVPEVRDRLDILALDISGNAVIIEVKRGKLKDPVDMQALRYASYISKWTFDNFEREAIKYASNLKPDYNFNEEYEKFCAKALVDGVPDINEEQRIIIVGSEVKDKLGSVALWLLEHSIGIKVVEVELYKDNDTLFFQPHVVVPTPVSRFTETGKYVQTDADHPWSKDGRTWHLEKRCSPQTKEMLLSFDNTIRSKIDVEGPFWNQKNYVAYRRKGYNWLIVRTKPSQLNLDIYVKTGSFEKGVISKQLGIEAFESDETMSEKMSLPTSINIKKLNEGTDILEYESSQTSTCPKMSSGNLSRKLLKERLN